MLEILQVVGVVLLALLLLYVVLGVGGNIVGAAITLVILTVAGPPAKVARLRRQNGRMREQARVARDAPANPLGERHEPFWALRTANIRLRGEMAGLSLDVPSDGPDHLHPSTRSERFCDWTDAYEHMFLVGAALTLCILAAAVVPILA